jgi:hypothetical protein
MHDIYLAESEQGNGSDHGTVIVRNTPDVVMIDRPSYGDNFPRPRFVSRSRSPQELPVPRKADHEATIDELDMLLAGLEKHEMTVNRNLSIRANSTRQVSAVHSRAAVDKLGVLSAGSQKLESPGPRISSALDRPQGKFAAKHPKDNKNSCTPSSKSVVINAVESLHRDLRTSVDSVVTSEFGAEFRHPSVQTPDFDAPTPDFDAPFNANSTVASHRRNRRNYLNLGHGAPNANPRHDTVFNKTLESGRLDKPSLVFYAPVKRQAHSDGVASQGLAETSTDEQSRSEATETTTPTTPPAEIPVTAISFDQFLTVNAAFNAKLEHLRHQEHLDSIPVIDTTADGLDVWGNPRPVRRKEATNNEEKQANHQS